MGIAMVTWLLLDSRRANVSLSGSGEDIREAAPPCTSGRQQSVRGRGYGGGVVRLGSQGDKASANYVLTQPLNPGTGTWSQQQDSGAQH